jgi:large subunit ribosomal protein L21
MKSAVINLKGHQYIVKENEELFVDHLGIKKGGKVSPDEVLAIYNDSKSVLDEKTLKKAKVVLEVIENKKGEKIRVSTYKSKSRYRKTKGFRPSLTKVKVKKIGN